MDEAQSEWIPFLFISCCFRPRPSHSFRGLVFHPPSSAAAKLTLFYLMVRVFPLEVTRKVSRDEHAYDLETLVTHNPSAGASHLQENSLLFLFQVYPRKLRGLSLRTSLISQ